VAEHIATIGVYSWICLHETRMK